MSAVLHPALLALAWALLHFLWQGTVLGLLCWAALRLARQCRPEVRYGLALLALGLMLAGFLGTVGILLEHPEGATFTVTLRATGQGVRALTGSSGLDLLRQQLAVWAPAILGAWLLGASLMLVRLARGYRWLLRTCLNQAAPVSPALTAQVAELSRKLGMAARIRLRVSEQVDSPVVVGILRPMILVPLAALLHLDGPALEAVLAHELAHVRRHDYLINLLQCLLETLFFYHPALWWVSRQVRLERELCCDDAAVRCCQDPILYASALARLEALRSPQPFPMHLAPAAKGGPLMLRIRRILAPDTHLPSGSSLPLLTSLALVLGLAVAGHTLQAAAPAPANTSAPEPTEMDFSAIRIVHQPAPPAYPPEAKAKGIQGTVVVALTIDLEGRVTAAEALEGPEELRECAVGYARLWTFEPARVNGKPVKARFRLTMPFKLN